MDVSQIGSANAYQSAEKTARSTGTELDKDAFLQILVSQLKNQDPLSPMEDKDFIAQMAQFSMLEQLQDMNAGNTFGQAAALVGKSVMAPMTDSSGMDMILEGVVTSVFARDGTTYLEIGGYSIPYDQNIVVFDNGSVGL